MTTINALPTAAIRTAIANADLDTLWDIMDALQTLAGEAAERASEMEGEEDPSAWVNELLADTD